jgi:hypothetical protein
MHELMEEELQEKIDAFKDKKIEECWDFIYFEAEYLVDSIMYREIGTTMNDTLTLPDRPERPGDSTGYEVLLDSSKLEVSWVDSMHVQKIEKQKDSLQFDSTSQDSIFYDIK